MHYPYEHYGPDDYDPDEWAERVERFADPGGHSALHAAGPDNPRDRRCPNCGAENVLTRADEDASYQCDRCADMAEGRVMPE